MWTAGWKRLYQSIFFQIWSALIERNMFLIFIKIMQYSLFKGRGVIEDDELMQRNSEEYLSLKWHDHEEYFYNQSIHSWKETLTSIHNWMHSWKNNLIRLRADYIGMMQCITIIQYWLCGGIMYNFRPIQIIKKLWQKRKKRRCKMEYIYQDMTM